MAKLMPGSDLPLVEWRSYEDILTTSLWTFDRRADNGAETFHGAFIPQLPEQFLLRYTKPGDVVLDAFIGSGTTAYECIRLGRRCIGVDLDPAKLDGVQAHLQGEDCLYPHGEDDWYGDPEVLDRRPYLPYCMLVPGSSADLLTWDIAQQACARYWRQTIDGVILHPPYWDIVQFSDDVPENASDLCHAESYASFLEQMDKVARYSYRALPAGKFAMLVVGDVYRDGEWLSLGFDCMSAMRDAGFTLKATIVKNMCGNERNDRGQSANLWRYRALAGGFNTFDHEYVFVLQK